MTARDPQGNGLYAILDVTVILWQRNISLFTHVNPVWLSKIDQGQDGCNSYIQLWHVTWEVIDS